MLRYSKESSASILKDFECGIQLMDEFIHNDLDVFLKNDPQYELYVAKDDELGIVAMYVISIGNFVDYKDEFQDLPCGKPWVFLDDDSQMRFATRYPTLEIDYLAVRKNLRESGYGSEIITELSRIAIQKNSLFLTVAAYHTDSYSAIPFYEKQGFFALQEYSEEFDTLRMAKRVETTDVHAGSPAQQTR